MKMSTFAEVALLVLFTFVHFSMCKSSSVPSDVIKETRGMFSTVELMLSSIISSYNKTIDNIEFIQSEIEYTLHELYQKPIERFSSRAYLSMYKPQLVTRTYKLSSMTQDVNGVFIDIDQLALEAQEAQIRVAFLIEKLRGPYNAYRDPQLEPIAIELGEDKILDRMGSYYRVVMRELKEILDYYKKINSEFQEALITMTFLLKNIKDYPKLESVKNITKTYTKFMAITKNRLSIIRKNRIQGVYNEVISTENQFQIRLSKDVLKDSPRDSVEDEDKPYNNENEEEKAIKSGNDILNIGREVVTNIMYLLC